VGLWSFFQKQNLDFCAGGFLGAKAGGDDAGVVHYQNISGSEQGGEVSELAVNDAAGGSVEGEQVGGIAGLGRFLSD
jgi:hypothetical protein